jgi:hypothetical protein
LAGDGFSNISTSPTRTVYRGGGVGLSGAAGEQVKDDACANSGMTKVAEQQIRRPA